MPLLLRAKAKGLDPQALKTQPKLPWYYEVLLVHFHRLSKRRTKFLAVTTKDNNVAWVVRPNPIDILTILQYNREVAKMDDPDVFLKLMESLDDNFLKRSGA